MGANARPLDAQSTAAWRRRLGLLLLVLACTAALNAVAQAATEVDRLGRRRGWGYLVDRLIADGIAPDRVRRVFADPRMPVFTGLSFSPYPAESAALYRQVLGAASTAQARRCRARHAAAFEAAERAYGVPASVVAAIIHTETRCGRNTGSSPIMYRLARLAMANEPDNLAANVTRESRRNGHGPALAKRMRERGRYLEDTFYPEVRAIFALADREGVDPLEMRGSRSGAFGYPQFLPSSYLRHAVDGDGDGRVSLYGMHDAAASCANYLARHGWHRDATTAERRSAVWGYNRSTAYIDAVLTLARRLANP